MRFYIKRPINYDYWKNPKEGFPLRINWKIVAGNRPLSILEESELVFDDRDLKMRQLDLSVLGTPTSRNKES